MRTRRLPGEGASEAGRDVRPLFVTAGPQPPHHLHEAPVQGAAGGANGSGGGGALVRRAGSTRDGEAMAARTARGVGGALDASSSGAGDAEVRYARAPLPPFPARARAHPPTQFLTPPPARSLARARRTSFMALWLARAGQRIAGWIMGLATAAFLIYYQWVVACLDSVARLPRTRSADENGSRGIRRMPFSMRRWVVEPAPPNSLAVRAFASAAKGACARIVSLRAQAHPTPFSTEHHGNTYIVIVV
jgi:raffinose synthase